MGDLDEISNWTMLVQALVKLDWKFRFYHHEHPLGIVPCVELTKTTQDTFECHTFYNTQEVWDWISQEVSNETVFEPLVVPQKTEEVNDALYFMTKLLTAVATNTGDLSD